jgi:hypothetical protein
MLSDPFITILTAITGNHSGCPHFARYLRPGAGEHFCGSAAGTSKKAVMVVRAAPTANEYDATVNAKPLEIRKAPKEEHKRGRLRGQTTKEVIERCSTRY